jgi:hypothetical protein
MTKIDSHMYKNHLYLQITNKRLNSTSSSPLPDDQDDGDNSESATFAFDENGKAAPHQGRGEGSRKPAAATATAETTDVVTFPVDSKDGGRVEYQPVLLNAKEHAVGYLSRILNARVYEAAVETELQHATNLSTVSFIHFSWKRCV